jgi:glycosyltransferase involved in cell wall biosynthesis
MANQTRQLAELLRGEGLVVEVVRTNMPYSPSWIAETRGARAVFRLVKYAAALWSAFGRCDVVHLMANSGWAWHLFAAPALWIAWLRGRAVVVNYRGGEAERFLAGSVAARPNVAEPRPIVAVPSRFLRKIFASHGVPAEVVPNIVDLEALRASCVACGAAGVTARGSSPATWSGSTTTRPPSERSRSSEASFHRAGCRLQESVRSRSGCGRLPSNATWPTAVAFVGRWGETRSPRCTRAPTSRSIRAVSTTCPTRILEALASGVPVVSTQVGGVPYMVDHGRTAVLVPPGDAQAMADGIARLLRDRDLAHQLASTGLLDVQQFGWPAVKDQWIEIYARLMPPVRGRAKS